jgi:CHAT domain-containing protein
MALIERGAILRAVGQLERSEHDLVAGLRILVKFDALAERFDAEVELARLRADQRRPDDALSTVRRALQMSREIRGQTANPEYRTSIAESLRPALEFEIEVLRARYDKLIQQGEIPAARRTALEGLVAVDASRAQAFEEWRAERFEDQSDKETKVLLRTSVELYHDIAEHRFRLAVRVDNHGTDDSKAVAMREEIVRLRTRAGIVNAELAVRTSSFSALSREPIALAQWSAWLKALPENHAFVEYWLGSTNAFAWVVTRQGVAWVPLATTSAIDNAARNLHTSLRSLNVVSIGDHLKACVEMYRLVLAPIANDIGSMNSVVFVPDGLLHYVSFAALRDENSAANPYLVQNHIISIAPALRFFARSATAGTLFGDDATQSRILIVADPVYTDDDPRLVRSPPPADPPLRTGAGWVREATDVAHLTRLTSTTLEADQIRTLYDSKNVDVLGGLDATRDNFLQKNLASYRFIHIASHGVVDADIPQLSALILGRFGSRGAVTDPYLRAGDLLAKTFNAQAIVFSACDTALGKQYAAEGIIGLRYAALARGAHAVVASLWPVSDGISAELMTDMYREMNARTINRGQSPIRGSSGWVAVSLGEAMRHILRQTPMLDPALWAPFVVYVAGG